jgi:hypothetical protein
MPNPEFAFFLITPPEGMRVDYEEKCFRKFTDF